MVLPPLDISLFVNEFSLRSWPGGANGTGDQTFW